VKKIFKSIFLLLLVYFSFFYTDKVINMINKKDPLMIELVSMVDNYNVVSIDGFIDENTIIPGVKGKTVDLDKSYENMKLGGVFREESLVFNDLIPNNSLINNKNKYIVKGNFSKKEISLLYIVKDNMDIDRLSKFNNLSLFVDSKYLTIENIKKIRNNEVYTYGKKGVYNSDILDNDNSLINSISNNKSIYCISTEKNSNILEICNDKDMYVVIPNIVGDYLDIKNNLTNGSIILLNSLDNINIISKYIKGKGYNIVGLYELLQE